MISKNLKITLIFFLTLTVLTSCGKDIFKKVDTRKTPTNALERAKKNVEEGRGVSAKGLFGGGKTGYEFSTSNPMWRSSLEILDFIPLSTVDYSGGLIISDWYNDSSDTKNSFKITVRFLSNEIQSNSLKITVHKKACDINNNVCSVKKVKSKIEEELATSILRNAAEIQKNDKNSKKK
jgi:hypothetical protein